MFLFQRWKNFKNVKKLLLKCDKNKNVKNVFTSMFLNHSTGLKLLKALNNESFATVYGKTVQCPSVFFIMLKS